FQVAAARNGVEGVQRLTEWEPDVVTLDINMPEMDGLTARALIMSARPTPVVMVSSLTEKGALATFEALALGAVDFIPKPGGTISLHVDDIKAMLLDKVRSASRAKVGAQNGGRKTHAARPQAKPAPGPVVAPPRIGSAPLERASLPGLVLIGVSTGGPRTLEDILPRLPANFPWPVLVAQHMPANFTETFARRIDGLCALKVVEVATPMPLLPGHVYIGRGGTDITVTDRAGVLHAAPRPEAPAVLWHPSVEVMVDSAMKHLPPNRLVGVMLTGMGNDGAVAMARLHAAGGKTIAESADTAVVFGMPHELIELGGASLVLPCNNIAAQLRHWLQ
ncbi:MAG: chemotaxis-specific protein-glutamate methyltransferase CheB, partial [Rubrivivax sp.]|nr:chemotaxis-specific protein-glutamate methyltransferase CheB [Rubrivivax sp.]